MKIRIDVITKKRYELGLSENETCKKAGISLSAFYRIKKGSSPFPRTIKKVAEILGLNVSDLIDFEEDKKEA